MTTLPSVPQTQDAGFSLTEVLAAVFIVALASSFIILSGPEHPDALTRQGDRVADLITRAADDAIISGNIRGVIITDAGYQPVTWHEQSWQPASDSIIPHEEDVRLAQSRMKKRLGISQTAELKPAFTMDPTGYATGEPVTFEFGNDTLTLSITNEGEIIKERTNERRF